MVRAPLREALEYGPEKSVHADGTHVALLNLSEWTARQGRMQPSQQNQEPQGATPKFGILTIPRGERRPLPRVQIRAFGPGSSEERAQPPLPLLEHTPVANAGFAIQSWHMHEKLPRAAFTGAGELVVFDTSQVPWKELARIRDPGIKSADTPFVFDRESLCLLQWVANSEQRAGFRLIRWAGGVVPTFVDCPRTDLPFNPTQRTEGVSGDLTCVEISPGEDCVLLLAGGDSSKPLRVTWLDTASRILSTQVSRKGGYSPQEAPAVAWWGKDGRFAIHEDGVVFHFRRTADALVFENMEKGRLNRDAVPKDAVPGERLRYPRWHLKRPDLLVRQDPLSGQLQTGFRLKQEFTGSPLWVGAKPGEVFLQGQDWQLVVVQPPGQ